MSYTIVVITAMLVHLIINYEYFCNREEKSTVNKVFKRYVFAALGYYVADALWGVVYELHIPALTYANTVVYYIAMALTVLLLCRYVTTYLRIRTGFGKFINIFGMAFGLAEIFILFINHYVPVFFEVDASGIYHAHTVRDIALYIQVILCVLLTIHTGYAIHNAHGEMKKRFINIFLFCLEMMIAIMAQIAHPLQPIYSIGLVVGISIINAFVKEGEMASRYNVLVSLADIHYSMHEIDLLQDTVEEFNAQDEVKKFVNHSEGASEMMTAVMKAVITDEYLDAVLSFVDLTTLSERMKGKRTISAQFIGKETGWFIAMFIATETDAEGRPTKVLFTTRVIDEEKKQEENLIHKSTTDELTGLLNRRAYEEVVYATEDVPDDFVYIALDVNGLKVINDSIGHAAGDEMIKGACECMKNVLGPYGKLFRTGGDEFVAIVYANEDKLNDILTKFDDVTSKWSGSLVDSLSVSHGHVSKAECPDFTVPQIATEADKRMYQAKSLYYRKKGVDRRGQQDAHKALSETYTKILKVNLTEDSYQIVNMFEDEKNSEKGFSDRISTWLQEFAKSGQVHEEDLNEYLEKTDITHMKEYFKNNDSSYIVTYRRRYDNTFKRVMLEIIRANDYSDEDQNLYLYVKKIEG